MCNINKKRKCIKKQKLDKNLKKRTKNQKKYLKTPFKVSTSTI